MSIVRIHTEVALPSDAIPLKIEYVSNDIQSTIVAHYGVDVHTVYIKVGNYDTHLFVKDGNNYTRFTLT